MNPTNLILDNGRRPGEGGDQTTQQKKRLSSARALDYSSMSPSKEREGISRPPGEKRGEGESGASYPGRRRRASKRRRLLFSLRISHSNEELKRYSVKERERRRRTGLLRGFLHKDAP